MVSSSQPFFLSFGPRFQKTPYHTPVLLASTHDKVYLWQSSLSPTTTDYYVHSLDLPPRHPSPTRASTKLLVPLRRTGGRGRNTHPTLSLTLEVPIPTTDRSRPCRIPLSFTRLYSNFTNSKRYWLAPKTTRRTFPKPSIPSHFLP